MVSTSQHSDGAGATIKDDMKPTLDHTQSDGIANGGGDGGKNDEIKGENKKLKTTKGGNKKMKKEMEQLKKIRKQELKQLNSLKKENNKLQKENKKMKEYQRELDQIKKQLHDEQTAHKKLQNTMSSKDNEIRILTRDGGKHDEIKGENKKIENNKGR